ncbi:MAG TPA: hypothetical protein VG389_12170 [Myxococcota bacterium]|jgi:hypothetical protein|nr:hypothetical protein [Myxococcota bacterium]
MSGAHVRPERGAGRRHEPAGAPPVARARRGRLAGRSAGAAAVTAAIGCIVALGLGGAAGCHAAADAFARAQADLAIARATGDAARVSAALAALERLAARRTPRGTAGADARARALRAAAAVLLEPLAATALARATATPDPALDAALRALAAGAPHAAAPAPAASAPAGAVRFPVSPPGAPGTAEESGATSTEAAVAARARALGDAAVQALLDDAAAGDAYKLRAAADAGGPLSTAAWLWLLARGADALDRAEAAPLHADLVLAAEYAVYCPVEPSGGPGRSALAARALLVDGCLDSCPEAQPDPSMRVSLEFRKDFAVAACGHAALGLPAPPESAAAPGVLLDDPSAAADPVRELSDEALVVQRHLADLLRRAETALRSPDPGLRRAHDAVTRLRAHVLAARVPLSYAFVTPGARGWPLAPPPGEPAAVVPLGAHLVVAADGTLTGGPRPTAGVGADGMLRFGDAEAGAPFPGLPLAAGAFTRALRALTPSAVPPGALGSPGPPDAPGPPDPGPPGPPGAFGSPLTPAVLLLADAAAPGRALRAALTAARAAGLTALRLGCQTAFGPFPCQGGDVSLAPATGPAPARTIDLGAGGVATVLFAGAAPFSVPGYGGHVAATALAAAARTLLTDGDGLVASAGADAPRGVRLRFADATTYAELLSVAQALAALSLRVDLSDERP